MADALGPCPFCGNAAEHDSQHWQAPTRPQYSGITGHAITCSVCQATMGVFDSGEDAIAAWNRRMPAPPISELKGTIPVVLYFGTRADADEFVAVVQEALPRLVGFKLP